MDEATASKMIETIRSIRLQLQAAGHDLDALERAIADELPPDE